MKRLRILLRGSGVVAAIALVAIGSGVRADHRHRSGRFDLIEATIPSIQQAIHDRIITPEQLVRMYLNRIAAYDAKTTAAHLNSYIHVNQDAVRDAREAGEDDDGEDNERPLFGIPIILKDNINTKKMPTTAGSVAFAGSIPRSDAFVTRKLLRAGAVILGKATMTEFANFLTNGMPAGYSSLGGYGYNPYDPRPDPRNAPDALGRPFNDGRPVLTPGGSSSGPGIAVAANLAAIGVLSAQGATVVTVTALAPQLGGCPSRPPAANYPPRASPPPGATLRCSTVLNYGFKRDLNKYIADHVRNRFPIRSLHDVVEFNIAFGPAATKYDQDLAIFSDLFDASPNSSDTARYTMDRAEDIVRSRGAIGDVLNGPDGIAGTADGFDALPFSGNSGAGTPAKAGYPSIVVPAGFFDNVVTPPFPAGFVANQGPAGVTFSGRAFSEPRLIGLAYAFEQATHARTPPASVPPLPTDVVIRP